MADITMCTGVDCPLKKDCYRYTAIKDEYYQSFLIEVPYDVTKQSCPYYWENNEATRRKLDESRKNR